MKLKKGKFFQVYRYFYSLFWGKRIWVQTKKGIKPGTTKKINHKTVIVELDKEQKYIKRKWRQVVQ